MSLLWPYFWPVLGAGAVCGIIAGAIGFRQGRKPYLAVAIGIAVALAAAALWHGPAGAADRFARALERNARQTLDAYEMTQIDAQLHRDPLSRRLVLRGPADDFQRGELVRVMGSLPGVREARWSPGGGGVPLLAEAMIAALAGFLTGVLLAYLVELRRRYNAQWKW
jgi:uncharacterized membrane protein YfcA